MKAGSGTDAEWLPSDFFSTFFRFWAFFAAFQTLFADEFGFFRKKIKKKRYFNLIDEGYKNILNAFSDFSSENIKKNDTFS